MGSINWLLNEPLFTGTAQASSAPYDLPVALAGHSYLIEPSEYRRSTIPPRRPAQDTSAEPGEQTLNAEGLWPRSATDWSLGAGQTFFDDEDSLRRRFDNSKGVDPWTRRELSLLPATERKRSSANTNLMMVVAGDRLYIADGQSVLYTTDPTPASPTWTTITGTPAADVTDLATNGFDVWAAFGASDLYKIAGGGSSAALEGAGTDTDVVGWVNGRLLAAHDATLYEVDGAGAYTDITPGHIGSSFVWRGITSAPQGAYVFGDANGDLSEIYVVTVDDADGSLNTPVFVGSLPLGERLRVMANYAGVMLLGTTLGIRLADIDQAGRLQVGTLIDAPGDTQAIFPFGRYVWFGWTNYDLTDTGLGRADLGADTFPDGSPPYASDVMAVAQGAVTAAARFDQRTYLAVSGDGFWGSTADKVPSGTIDSGLIRFGTFERKVATYVGLKHLALDGTIEVDLEADDGGTADVGTSSAAGSSAPASEFKTSLAGEGLKVKLTLNRSAADTTLGPVLRRWSLRVLPAPRRVDEIILPIIWTSSIHTLQGEGRLVYQDLLAEYDFLRGLEEAGEVVTFQEGTRSEQVFVDQVQLVGRDWADDLSMLQGMLFVRLITT